MSKRTGGVRSPRVSSTGWWARSSVCQSRIRDTLEHARERDLRLQPGQRRAQAVVDAEPEGHGPIVLAAQVERVRVREAARVSIRAGLHEHHALARLDGPALIGMSAIARRTTSFAGPS
jgi:hypothetical protein